MSPGHIKQALNRLATAAYRKLKNVSTNMRYSGYREKYDIHETFTFNGEGVLLYGPGEIVIGEHSYIGRFSQIQAQDGTSVIIGKKCRISHFVAVYTANTEADEDLLASTTSRVCKGSVRIGDGCWIGYGVFICEGVTIGEGTVVGANSVVTKDLPANCIAAGCPARVIRMKDKNHGAKA